MAKAQTTATMPEPAVTALVEMATIALRFRGGETQPTIAEIARVVNRCSVIVLKVRDEKSQIENDAVVTLARQLNLMN